MPPIISEKAATFAHGPNINIVPEPRTAIGVGEPEIRDSMKSEEIMLLSSEVARSGSFQHLEQTQTLDKRA